MDAPSPRAERTVNAPCPQGPGSNVLFAFGERTFVLLEGLTGTAQPVAFGGFVEVPKSRALATELRPSGERIPPEPHAANVGLSAQSSVHDRLPVRCGSMGVRARRRDHPDRSSRKASIQRATLPLLSPFIAGIAEYWPYVNCDL